MLSRLLLLLLAGCTLLHTTSSQFCNPLRCRWNDTLLMGTGNDVAVKYPLGKAISLAACKMICEMELANNQSCLGIMYNHTIPVPAKPCWVIEKAGGKPTPNKMMMVHTCNSTCLTGTFLSGNGQCARCDDSCSACVKSSAMCSACKGGYFSSTPVSQAKPGLCKRCDSSCAECTKSAKKCTMCTINYFASTPVSKANPGPCTKCDMSCSSCTKSPKMCTACNSTGYFSSPLVSLTKPGSCKKCDASCSSCTISAKNCTSCPAGYYSSPQPGPCKKCDSTCATCHGAGPKACNTCKLPALPQSQTTCNTPPACVAGNNWSTTGYAPCKACTKLCTPPLVVKTKCTAKQDLTCGPAPMG